MRLLDSAPIFWYFRVFAHPFSHNIHLLVRLIALAGLLGYLIGSIPTAYLLVRGARRMDIRGAGSGNVGALNSYEVTGSPLIGALVLLVDAAKGVAAVLAARWLGSGDFAAAALAGVAAVFGHNYSVWVGLKGGRGLATAAGVFAIIAWPVIAGWIICWIPAYAFLRRVNPASAVASTALIVVALAVPHHSLSALLPATVAPGQLVLLVVAMMLVILSRLIEPFDRFLEERKQTRKRGPGA